MTTEFPHRGKGGHFQTDFCRNLLEKSVESVLSNVHLAKRSSFNRALDPIGMPPGWASLGDRGSTRSNRLSSHSGRGGSLSLDDADRTFDTLFTKITNSADFKTKNSATSSLTSFPPPEADLHF